MHLSKDSVENASVVLSLCQEISQPYGCIVRFGSRIVGPGGSICHQPGCSITLTGVSIYGYRMIL